MIRVGLFGGTFDPIHNGHLHVARTAKKMCSLDDIIFIPAKISPMKTDRVPHASANDRLEMVRLAIGEEFSVSEIEVKKEGASYTIDTVRAFLEATGESVEYHLLLGGDSVESFAQWKEAPSLIELAPPIVVVRKGFAPEGKKMVGMKILSVPTVDVSSTEIRNN